MGTRNDLFDGDSPNLDNFLPFSLRDVAIARAILNGKNEENSLLEYFKHHLQIHKA